jgi:DNA modification methylase
MKVETWPIDRVIPYARNPRKNEASVDAVAASIKEFGWRVPIVVDADGVIVTGHTRHKAARRLGMTEVPVHVADGLTAAQVKAYRIADNSAGSKSEWDAELLGLELGELPDFDAAAFGLDLGGLGMDEPEGDADADPQVDRAEELNEKWKVKTGDLWLIGGHRLLCGDSTKAEDVGRLLDGAVPVLMVTDPPYGVEYDPAWRAEAGVNKNKGKMGKVSNDDIADWSPAWRMFPGDVAYVWHASMMTSEVVASLEVVGFERRSMIIWNKDRFTLGRGHYHWRHEPAWYCVRKGCQGHWGGSRDQDTVWNIKARDDSGHGHGTQKPIECMARPMRNHDAPEVYDPFLGSGTTMVAAQNLGRKCYGLEISPAYCAVILERMVTAFPSLAIIKS